MSRSEHAITVTRSWIEKVVLKYQLCPFAKLPFDKDQIRYRFLENPETDQMLAVLKEEFAFLESKSAQECETTLLIMPDVWPDFHAFWEFSSLADSALEEWAYEGVFQVATFHPKYQFAGTKTDDAGNYTNRAPYPILHLLREESVEKAIESHPNIDLVPIQNMEKMKNKGREFWQQILNELSK